MRGGAGLSAPVQSPGARLYSRDATTVVYFLSDSRGHALLIAESSNYWFSTAENRLLRQYLQLTDSVASEVGGNSISH